MLVAREAQVTAEHEELLSMNHDLMRKLQAERAEITRLRDEIQEMQTLYGYRYNTEETELMKGQFDYSILGMGPCKTGSRISML